jgi:hypothetical protein
MGALRTSVIVHLEGAEVKDRARPGVEEGAEVVGAGRERPEWEGRDARAVGKVGVGAGAGVG